MNELIQDVMTREPITVTPTETVAMAARKMREADVGSIIVQEEGGEVCGIVTDRDIAVRAVAQDLDPKSTPIRSICSDSLAVLHPEDEIQIAIKLMARKGIRRIPVVEDGHAVGIVSLGDLAQARDPQSALGSISSSPANL